jgi:hypothetical protein
MKSSLLNATRNPEKTKTFSEPLTVRLIVLAIAAVLAAVILSACNTAPENDAEYDKYKDTPVTQGTAQASLTAQAAYMANWDDNTGDPVSVGEIPGMGAGAEWPAMQKPAGLDKIAANDVFVIDSSTAAQGYATFSVTRTGILNTTYDSARVKWDAQARDNVSGNENVISWTHTVVWFNGGLTERAAFSDADGNGLVNVVAGGNNRVRIDFRKQWNVGNKETVETAVVTAGTGPDDNFDAEADNRLFEAQWRRLVNGTLTASVVFADEDGDGRVLDNAAVSVVRLTAWEHEPAFRPKVKGVKAVLRVRKLGHGLGEEPVGFEYTDTLWNGRTSKVFLRNSDGGDEIRANDTLRVFVQTRQSASSDTLRTLDVEVALNLGSNLKSENDDVFYSLKVEAHNRLGFHKDVELAIVSSTPVPRGQEVQNGTFTLDVTYANNKSISLDGTFTPTSFDGLYTGPEGDTATVHINR